MNITLSFKNHEYLEIMFIQKLYFIELIFFFIVYILLNLYFYKYLVYGYFQKLKIIKE